MSRYEASRHASVRAAEGAPALAVHPQVGIFPDSLCGEVAERLKAAVFANTAMVNATEILSNEGVLTWNVEGTAAFGPLHAQGEYSRVHVDRNNFPGTFVPAPTLIFDGWYVQAGWFITGESRTTGGRIGTWSCDSTTYAEVEPRTAEDAIGDALVRSDGEPAGSSPRKRCARSGVADGSEGQRRLVKRCLTSSFPLHSQVASRNAVMVGGWLAVRAHTHHVLGPTTVSRCAVAAVWVEGRL